MITPTSTDDLLKWDIGTLWSSFQTIMTYEDEEEKLSEKYKKEIEQVKNGIKIKVPIWYITNMWYEEHPSKKGVKILGYGRQDINNFQEEIEARKTIMRNIIHEETQTDDLSQPDMEEENGSRQ